MDTYPTQEELTRRQEFLDLDGARRERVVELLAMVSPQQGQFVFEFIRTLNPKEAAIRVGFPVERSQANNFAYRAINNPAVKELIGLLLETQITKEEVIGRIADIARFDYGDLLRRNEDTGLMEFDLDGAKSKGLTQYIKGFSYGKQGVRVEVYDKLQALGLLAKHLGLLTDKVETGNGAFKVLVEHVQRAVADGESEKE